MERKITFHKLHKDDMELMYKWLTTDFVHKWYDKDKDWTLEQIEKKYVPYANLETSVHPYVMIVDGEKAGYIQTYLIDDYPDYAQAVGIEENAAGLDLFIGEAEYIHKGLGSQIIRTFLDDVVFDLLDINLCIIGPEPDNKSAIKAYEKAGFAYQKTVLTDAKKDEWEYIMTRHR